jgi:hypothetical protein
MLGSSAIIHYYVDKPKEIEMEKKIKEYVRLSSIVNIGGTSQLKDEALFESTIGKIKFVLLEYDALADKRREVKTIQMSMRDAKKLRTMLDAHIKLNEK